MAEPLIRNADAFARRFNVSRETLDAVGEYHRLLLQWQPVINLVAPKTIDEAWHRHFADSAQLANLIPPTARSIVDLGSGAGFPGLVLAILLKDRLVDGALRITLIESDQRKAAFLREVARSVDNPVHILSTRIESSASVNATGAVDIVVARALAPLDRLLELASPFCSASTMCVFPKGRNVTSEVQRAEAEWSFDVRLVPSCTDDDSRIACLERIRRNRSGSISP